MTRIVIQWVLRFEFTIIKYSYGYPGGAWLEGEGVEVTVGVGVGVLVIVG
jgi:hypothetical protein